MAKQLSWKQQIYQQIADSHVQQALNQQREQERANLMADFDAWKKQDMESFNVLDDFNAWKSSQNPQPVPVKQATVNEVKAESVPTQQIPSIEDFFKVKTASGKDINKESAKFIQRNSHAKQQQIENELASKSASKKEPKVGQRPEATDFSSQVAARVTNEKIPEINTANVPVNVDRWLSPDTKLTEAEKKKAKEYASAELQKVQYGPNKQPLLNTPEERQHYADMVNLINKTNGFTNFMSAGLESFYNLADTVSDKARSVGNQLGGLGAAITDKLGATEGATQRHNEQAEIANQFADQNEANMRQSFKNAQTQNPGAYTTGKIAGQTAMYMLTNPVFDGIAAGAGVESELAKFFINQGAQNVQDLVLDTAPTVKQLMEDGATPEEVKREALNNILWNAAGNAVLGGLGAWAGNRVARKASDEAFRESVRAGADNLSRIANEIPGIEDADNVVRNATRQAEEASNNIKNIAQQIPKLPEENYATDIYKDTKPFTITEDIDEDALLRESLIDNGLKRIAEPMESLDRSGIMEGVTNKTALKSYARMKDAYQNYAEVLLKENATYEELEKAARELGNARKSFGRNMKNIDPSIAKQFDNMEYGELINQPMYNRLGTTKRPAQIEDELRAVYEAEGRTPEEIEDLIARSRETTSDVGYEIGRDDNAISQEEFEAGQKRLQDLLNSTDENKVLTEEISKVNRNIEPGKYQIPDTPENAPIEQITDGNKKLSETYTNTGRNGGGWNAEEYNKYTDPEKYMYETIDEVTSVENATKMRQTEGREAFKERVLGAERVSSIELDGLMMEWRELTQEARALEEAGQDASKLWDESNRIFRKIREQSTSNAQALQALAKWSRNTPEGMLVEAENIINGRVAKEKSAMQKALDKYLKQNKIEIEFSPEFEKKFLKEAEKIEGLRGSALDSREAKEVMANLGKMVNEQIPVKMGDKLTTWLMDNMLGNFRTLISRNAGGNIGLNAMEQTLQRPLAAGIDSLVSLKTGKRTQAGLSVAGIADYLSGFKKGLADELKDVKTGLHTARSGENTLSNAIQSNKRVFKSRLLNLKDQLTRHGLSVGDRPFYESVYKQTLGDYDRLYKSGKMGADIQKLSPEEFKEYSEIAAHLNALGAVYQQDTTLSKALMGFKKDIGDLSKGTIGIDVLSQFSMPFVKTPANVIERAIDYSPLGAVRNTFRTAGELNNSAFDQNRFVNETARNIIGTGLMGGGLALAKNGVLSGAYSDNKDKKQAQKESGMQEYAWNVPEYIPGIGGKQMDISWVPVLGSNLVASAAAYDAYRNGEGDKLGNMATGLKKGGEALFDQSMFQGLQRLFGTGDSYNSDEGIVGNMANTVKSGLGQAIPSLVRQIAQVKDPYMRDTAYSNKGTSLGFMDNYDINSLANNVPELREQYLAPKVDTQGNLLKENQGRGLGSKVLEDMFLPGKLTEIQSNALSEEAQRLSDISGTGKAYIDKANRSLVDTEDHTLTNQEWVDYQQKYYKQMNSAGNKLIESDFYKSLDDTAKENTLSNMYSDIKSAVNSEYNGKELTGGAKVYAEAGGGDKGADALLKYYNAKQISKDAGVTTSSNAGKAIQEAINNGDTAEANKIAKEEANYNRACEVAGVTDKNSGTRKAYEEGGTVGLKEYVKKQQTIEKYDLENNSTAKSVYDKYGENGLSQLSEFQKAGVKGGSAVGLYNSAKEELGSEVPTLKEYATTYKKMDSYGSGDKKNNGTVSQDEFISFLDDGNYSEEQAQYYAALYGDWKTHIRKTKDGWKFKKK